MKKITDHYKFIQMNIWEGRLFYPLKRFFDREKADLLCVQEMLCGGRSIGPDHLSAGDLLTQGWFETHVAGGTLRRYQIDDVQLYIQCAVFAASNISCHKQTILALNDNGRHRQPEDGYFHLLHAIATLPDGALINVLTYHMPLIIDGKSGNSLAEENCEKIARYVKTLTGPLILSGDFNLVKEATSLKHFHHAGLENLNERYGITAARNEFSWKPDEAVSHIFINDQIDVHSYTVATDPVSDHCPLILTFSIR